MVKKRHMVLKRRLEKALGNKEVRLGAFEDFSMTFNKIGLSKQKADNLALQVIAILMERISLTDSEKKVFSIFKKIRIKGKPFLHKLSEKLKGREKLIISQVKPYLYGIKGKVIDFGAGSGKIAQGLHDKLGLYVEGYDVRYFKDKNVTVPIKKFNGKRVPVPNNYFEAGVMTNVAHHEEDNERILRELTRIVSKRLVVIETVPIKDKWEERERTFVNDALWNRYFNYADIPVPGTYETPKGWIKRFLKHGWKVMKSKDLGFDQPTIRDLHHLLVLNRGKHHMFIFHKNN